MPTDKQCPRPVDALERSDESRIAHFYHVYCAGDWHVPVAEHLLALEVSSYSGPFVVGVVGPPSKRKEALSWIGEWRIVDDVIHADDGAEQVTINALDGYAEAHDGSVMYAHTKGASTPSHVQTRWRHEMTRHVVRGWSSCEHMLALGHDAVGCYWVSSRDWPGDIVPHPFWGWGHFSGNFWVASCAYLRTLPAPSMMSRYGAEAWLGSGPTCPRILDLLPNSVSPHRDEHIRRHAIPE